jgi:hypothetical protein
VADINRAISFLEGKVVIEVRGWIIDLGPLYKTAMAGFKNARGAGVARLRGGVEERRKQKLQNTAARARDVHYTSTAPVKIGALNGR